MRALLIVLAIAALHEPAQACPLREPMDSTEQPETNDSAAPGLLLLALCLAMGRNASRAAMSDGPCEPC